MFIKECNSGSRAGQGASPRLLPILAALALGRACVFAQTNFTIAPNLALQTTFPTQESYQYQIDSSTNLATWTPASPLMVATGSVMTLSFATTNGPGAFYRGQVFPPDLTRRLVGLTNIYFDNAIFTPSGGGAVAVSDFRAISRDYSLNDFLAGQFQFDLALQTFSLSNLQISPNLGVVCGQSPMFCYRDATNALLLTNGSTVLAADTSHTITSTGQVMTANLQPGQSFGMFVTQLTVTNQIVATGPQGTEWSFVAPPLPGGNWYYLSAFPAVFPGNYTIQFIPQGAASGTVGFSFHNCNTHAGLVLTNGSVLNTVNTCYQYDYNKFQVNLMAGQTLRMGAANSLLTLALYNSLGVSQVNLTGIPLIYTAKSAGTFYIILYSSAEFAQDYDAGTESYSTAVSITP